jgi:hypothetical protein
MLNFYPTGVVVVVVTNVKAAETPIRVVIED